MIVNPTGVVTEEKAAFTAETGEATPGASSVTVKPVASDGLLTKVTVKGDSNLVASNIRKGVTIFGVTGTYATSVTTTYNLPYIQFDTTGYSFTRFATTDDTDYAYWSMYKQVLGSQTFTPVYGKLSVTTDSSGSMTSWSSEFKRRSVNYTEPDSGVRESPYHMFGQWKLASTSFGVSKAFVYSGSTQSSDDQTTPKLPNGTYGVKISGWQFYIPWGYVDGASAAAGLYSSVATATMTVKGNGSSISFTSITLPSAFNDAIICTLGLSAGSIDGFNLTAQVSEVTSFVPS